MKRAVAIVCLGLWGFSATAFAAGSKSSGTITIVDDLTTGSAGSVNLTGGAFQLSGSLGQLGTTRVAGGASTVDIGYFNQLSAPATPTAFAGTAQSATSIRWTWSDNAIDEDGYRVMSGTVNVSGDLAANTTAWLQTGLTTNTLYGPFFARAFNAGGTADSNTASRTTLAAAPANLAVNAVSSTTISLAWSANGNPGGTLYELQRSTGGPFAFRSTGTATAFTDTGLTPLVTYQYQVRAFNGDSIATAFNNQVSTQTSAPDAPGTPTGFAGAALGTTRISWTWNDNAANELGYRVLSGTVNVSGDLAANTTAWLQTGLSTNTLYGPFFARAFNAGGTADSNTASRTTLAAAPANLAVNAVSSTTISLAWSANGNPGGTVYELQLSTGGPFAFLSTSTATAFTDTGLTPQTTYQYQVRAFNGESVATAFSNQVSTRTSSPDAATVRTVITSPKNGKKIRGNFVTVAAKLILGTPAQTLNVLFQYKSSSSLVWLNIISASAKEQNPDPTSPYYIHWNLNILPPGAYDLRAVAASLSGTPDPAPPTITIINDSSSSNLATAAADGDAEIVQTVNMGAADTIMIGAEGINQLISLGVAAGAVNIDTASITMGLSAPGSHFSKAVAVQETGATSFAEVGISFGEPGAALAPGQVMMLAFSYGEGGAHGVLDWTSSRTGPPALYSYDAASASWRRESAPDIDSENRTISALISHTGVFALRTPAAAATAAADLSQVRVYPIPYKPNGGDPDYGARFDPGNPNSGIIFDNLTQASTIKIYTATGQLVTSFDSNAPTGRIQWDARNGAGRDVATGFYVAVISSPGQSAQTRKMMIIR